VAYGKNPADVIEVLNEVLATEIVCWMRYSRPAISVTENLAAERVVIAIYEKIIRWLGDGDATTRRMLEDILADEEEHADDIIDLLGGSAS
jgi:bacterioferritin (cytochrome b1)